MNFEYLTRLMFYVDVNIGCDFFGYLLSCLSFFAMMCYGLKLLNKGTTWLEEN